jgi:S1-C subfamily serine protease
MLDVICRLADEETLPEFRSASRAELASMRSQREAPLAPGPPRLGLRWAWLPEESTEQKSGSGKMRVTDVTPGSAADVAGIRVGDVLTAIDGAPLPVEEYLPAAVLRAKETIVLEVERGEEPPQTIKVKLAGEPTALGLSWRPDSALTGAVTVTRVVPYSPASRAEIAVHDRIYRVEGEPFTDHDALLQRVRELLDGGAESMTLEVETAGRIRPVEVDLRLPAAEPVDSSL